MLNKKNIIISSLATVMLTCSFNYIAIAGLGNIDIKGVNSNTNLSVNKPSHLSDSIGKGLAVQYHALVLKNIDTMKSRLNSDLPKPFIGDSKLEDNPVLVEKRKRALEMIQALEATQGNEEILNSFNPHQVRLTRLHKDHKNSLVKINADNAAASALYQKQTDTHKSKMQQEERNLDQQISSLQDKIKGINDKIKEKELTIDSDVSNFFKTSIQPMLTTTVNFNQLTVGSLATTISFR